MLTKRIYIGCDNAAVALKEDLKAFLSKQGYEAINIGCANAADTTLYPYIAETLCRAIREGGFRDRGILLCGTGLGMCITANKCPGIRAALCHDNYSAERSVLSNNANVLCMGERVIGHELAKKILGEWLTLEFMDGSSTEKVNAIIEIERKNFVS